MIIDIRTEIMLSGIESIFLLIFDCDVLIIYRQDMILQLRSRKTYDQQREDDAGSYCDVEKDIVTPLN